MFMLCIRQNVCQLFYLLLSEIRSSITLHASLKTKEREKHKHLFF